MTSVTRQENWWTALREHWWLQAVGVQRLQYIIIKYNIYLHITIFSTKFAPFNFRLNTIIIKRRLMVPSTVIYFYQYGSFMGHPHPFWQRPGWRNWGCKVACRWAAVGRLKQLNQLTLYMRCVSLEELSHQQSELTSWPAWNVHGFQLVFTHIKTC